MRFGQESAQSAIEFLLRLLWFIGWALLSAALVMSFGGVVAAVVLALRGLI